MLALQLEDVKKVVTMEDAIEAIQDAFISFSRGKAVVPVRIQIPVTENNTNLAMPAYLKDKKELGLKVVSVFQDNLGKNLPVVLGFIAYLDSETGKLLAIMDGTYLTAIRTGAAGGVACRWLSRQNSKTVAIIGTGAQARTQLWAAKTVRPLSEVFVYDLSSRSAKEFHEWAASTFKDITVTVTSDANSAVEKADIVITTTTSTKPVFDARALKAGTHINAVGAFKPTMQEIPEEAILKANKVVVDSVEAAMEEAGDLIIPINKGNYSKKRIYAEIGEIALGEKKGRENDTELTIFKTVGIAVQDVAIASLVYRKAKEQGLGQEINVS